MASIPDNNDRFASRQAAHAWVVGQGCKVSKSKFYDDCAAGVITVHPDKSVSRWQVSEYLVSLLRSAAPQPAAIGRQEQRESLEMRKLASEVLLAEAKARREDEAWMRTEDAWAAVAALLASLRDNLRHQMHQAKGVLVHLAGGEPEREAEVYEECLAVIGRAYNDLAGGMIEGIFAQDNETEERVDDGAE